MAEVHSVRGKGWVKFEDEGGPASPPAESPPNNEAPGSLEVSQDNDVLIKSINILSFTLRQLRLAHV